MRVRVASAAMQEGHVSEPWQAATVLEIGHPRYRCRYMWWWHAHVLMQRAAPAGSCSATQNYLHEILQRQIPHRRLGYVLSRRLGYDSVNPTRLNM